MQFRTALLVAVVAVALVAGASASAGEVLDLNEKTFDAAIAEHDLTLVEFFAPWCGHCKSLAPEYEKAAKDLVGKNAGVLAKVDCTVERDLCSRFDVKGFPTLKLFRKESPTTPSEYDQARKAEAIVKFMVKQNQPAVTELASEDAVAGFAAGESVKVVGYGAVPALAAVAGALRNEFSFASVASASGAARVVLFRNFDEGDITYTGDLASASELTAFIKGQSFPLVGEIGPENYQKYLERGFNFVWVFIDPESEEQAKLITDVVTPAAATHRSSLSFVKLDGLRWAEHAKSFGLSGSTPGIVLENRQKSRNFVFGETAPTTASFAAWVQGVVDGSIAPTVKSEPIPTSNDGPVTVVVGKTFESIVLDDTKDVFVEFYAPWCGHCKTLAPKYDELGALFADDASTVIAKIDATANDSPAEVSGFPTLIFYPAGDKSNPVNYNGARTAEAMAEFVRENKKATATAAPAAAAEAHGEEL